MASSTQNERESRFAHLLQPIRDLATNWDIDLASELEDYLTEVRLLSCYSCLLFIIISIFLILILYMSELITVR